MQAALELISKFSQGQVPWKTNDPKMMKPVWRKVIEAAEKHDDPGRFTAFIGYEWTSLLKGNNLHRVVIYRDDADQGRPVPCPTRTGRLRRSGGPLEGARRPTRRRRAAPCSPSPHNGNMSNGMMFAETTATTGSRSTPTYCRRRASAGSRSMEVDPDQGRRGDAPAASRPTTSSPTTRPGTSATSTSARRSRTEMLPYEYATLRPEARPRSSTKRLGTNPFQFGMIGSTDSHTALMAVEEECFFGKHSGGEPTSRPLERTSFMDTPNGKHQPAGRRRPPATPACGPPRTRARPSGTRSPGARSTPRARARG